MSKKSYSFWRSSCKGHKKQTLTKPLNIVNCWSSRFTSPLLSSPRLLLALYMHCWNSLEMQAAHLHYMLFRSWGISSHLPLLPLVEHNIYRQRGRREIPPPAWHRLWEAHRCPFGGQVRESVPWCSVDSRRIRRICSWYPLCHARN